MIHTATLQSENSYLLNRRYNDAASRSPQTRILLIEDNKSDVFLLKKMLIDVSGHNHFEFTDVARMTDAFKLLDHEPFDLILLDLNLLDIDGTASVAALHAEVPHIPIIVYSGTDDPKLKTEALICGAKHYLVKGRESPFSLKFMIQEALTLPQA